MRCNIVRSCRLAAWSTLAVLVWAAPARAQVTEVEVGVTPSCPYGLSSCWAGAYEALGKLEGVQSVATTPDAYNCTAHVYLKDRSLPDVAKWAKQFESLVGKSYEFRGVEVTIRATVEVKDGRLVLQAPGLKEPVALAPLEHRLQWNFKKSAARQPEPDERDAYQQLAARNKEAKGGGFRVEVTGPLRVTDKGPVLEVREFFPTGR